MKLHLSSNLLTLAMMATVAGSAFAASVTEIGPIDQSTTYRKMISPKTPDTTYEFSSIKSGGNVEISVGQSSPGSTVISEINYTAESIEATGNVIMSTYNGDIHLGDVKGNTLAISTNKGNITLTGNIQSAVEDGSTISISANGTPGGYIILDGASISNVGLTNIYWYENNNQAYGQFSISGDTKLSGVYFDGASVDVAAGATLSLDNVLFTTRENSNNGLSASTSLVLGDNVTLTLNAGDTLDVKSLTIGNNVDFVVTLSSEEFLALEDSKFDLFSVVEGEVDFSNVSFTFTDGEQFKTGTIDATAGSICVTNTQIVYVPEPATATLSLLALCGLAARRRRK